jgi:hypothetical protein
MKAEVFFPLYKGKGTVSVMNVEKILMEKIDMLKLTEPVPRKHKFRKPVPRRHKFESNIE